jgi:hypothetical protein
MSSLKDSSLLLIGVIPIPITPDMRIISTNGDAYYNYVYEKYSSDPNAKEADKEYYEDMNGAASKSLEFAIPFDRESPTTKALSLVLPIFELVAYNLPKPTTFQYFNNQSINSFINKQRTLISYYDATGFCTFFNYKLDSVRFTEDKNENILYLSITATKDSSPPKDNKTTITTDK